MKKSSKIFLVMALLVTGMAKATPARELPFTNDQVEDPAAYAEIDHADTMPVLELERDVEVPAEEELSAAVMPAKLVIDRRAALVEKVGGQTVGQHLKKQLTSQRFLGTTAPVAFTLFEERQVFCAKAPCPPVPVTRHFAVISTENAGCGSLRYVAKEANPDRGVLVVTDHSRRTCKDLVPAIWMVTLEEGDGRRVRQLLGNPTVNQLGIGHID